MGYLIDKCSVYLKMFSFVLFFLAYSTVAFAGDAVLSWDSNDWSIDPDLAGYKVYHGTVSGNYTNTIDIGLVNPNDVPTYTVVNLTDGNTYYFAVTAYDTAGNESGFSNEVSKIIGGTTVDTTPPTISFISASSITSSNTTINWTTNESATTQVEFGTTTAYGSASALNSTLVASHSQALSGLQASTIYHYRVKSTDGAGNTAVSADNTFTTSAAPDTTAPAISSISSSSITSDSATIIWTTNESATTQVEYGTTTAYGSVSALNSTLVTNHSQALSGLQPSTIYYYRVKSTDAAGNMAISMDNIFITSAAPDTTPPAISSISSISITSSSATIIWITNEASTSQVEYGTTTSYGSVTALSSTLITGHSQTPSSLQASTIYHYRVKSADAAGNLSVSGDNIFTTPSITDTTPPLISGITTSKITRTSAVIRWTTNEASTSQIEYGTTVDYGSVSTLDSTLNTSHSRTLSGLQQSTTYHYRVKSTDASGNMAISGDNVFTTSRRGKK